MTEADRKKAQVERQRRAALRSSVIQELRQQYSDTPEEIRDRRDFQSERESREELHRCLHVCIAPATFQLMRLGASYTPCLFMTRFVLDLLQLNKPSWQMFDVVGDSQVF